MRASGQTWLTALILLAALLARLHWPAEAAELRRGIARVLAADRESLACVQAMGRAAADGDWTQEAISALWRERQGSEA